MRTHFVQLIRCPVPYFFKFINSIFPGKSGILSTKYLFFYFPKTSYLLTRKPFDVCTLGGGRVGPGGGGGGGRKVHFELKKTIVKCRKIRSP
jgi:hypothetical protein